MKHQKFESSEETVLGILRGLELGLEQSVEYFKL